MTDIAANKAIVRDFLAAIEEGDLARIEALNHPDAQWWILGIGEVDRSALLATIRDSILPATSRKFTIYGMIGEGDRVSYEASGEMHFADRVYRNIYHTLMRIQDGRIIEAREYLDPRNF